MAEIFDCAPMTQVVLICPPGAQHAEISHGGHEFLPYREHRRWLVCVPESAARHLCWNEGFRLLRPAIEESV